jgi:hypothetical protein
LTAQLVNVSGREPVLLGMSRQDADNQQFALNVFRWLMGLID